MKKPGRPTEGDLLVRKTEYERLERPKPPFDLSDEGCEVWLNVVNDHPADWFSPATYPLLTQYCRHTIQARRIAAMIEKATGDRTLPLEDQARLLRMQSVESQNLTRLATKMRISQQATRLDYGTLRRAGGQGPQIGVRKPWEI
jgi:hypothetical protein